MDKIFFNKSDSDLVTADLTQFELKEKSFSLGSLLEMDTFLTKDRHFTEMFRECNLCCSPEFIQKVQEEKDPNGVLQVVITGQLRGLLIEATTGSKFKDDPYERKKAIEEVYYWYREKKRLLLYKRLREDEEFVTAHEKDDDLDETIVAKKKAEKLNVEIDDEQLSLIKDIPSFANTEKKKKMFISNKLKQYKKRNLKSTLYLRKRQEDEPKFQEKELTLTRVDVPAGENSEEIERKLRKWKVSDKGSKSVDLLQELSKQRENMQKVENEPKVFRHWIRHRAQEAQEHLEQMEFDSTVDKWISNRARIEEEIQRRQESLRYASQTGVNVHKIIRTTDLEKEQMEKRMKKKQAERERQQVASKNQLPRFPSFVEDPFLEDDDFSEEDDDLLVTKKKKNRNQSSLDSMADEDDDEDEDEEDDIEEDDDDGDEEVDVKVDAIPSDVNILLSPYQNLKKRQLGMYSHDEVNNDPDQDDVRGFRKPEVSLKSEPVIFGYDQIVGKFDGTNNEEIEIENIVKPDDFPGQHPNVVLYSVFAPVKPPTPIRTKKKRGKKTQGRSQNMGRTAKKSDKKEDKEKEEKKEEKREFKISSPRPITKLRISQLEEVEKIKNSLARDNIRVPYRDIKMSLKYPREYSFQDCVTFLPKKRMFLLKSINEVIDKPKKRKRGGKKRKKKQAEKK